MIVWTIQLFVYKKNFYMNFYMAGLVIRVRELIYIYMINAAENSIRS